MFNRWSRARIDNIPYVLFHSTAKREFNKILLLRTILLKKKKTTPYKLYIYSSITTFPLISFVLKIHIGYITQDI